MKIDSSYKPTTPSLAPKAPAAQPAPAATTAEAVSLSQLAGSLQGNEKPPINSARIQEIKQAISEGRFKINPEVIADRLIESARDLVNSSGKRQA
ncbi:MAG: flagellar biosynthesis anti-sigma factor FlgM [Dechloromonas sp.]|nr:flagellar biosynthesis anti-sigma factor FlgM [Dechloromonas sp.]HXE37055.1 flagellar biosynthesis anti-sigma factor FlgM [Azonexus sp.]